MKFATMVCLVARHDPESHDDGKRWWTVCRRCGHVSAATPFDAAERAYGSRRDFPRSAAC